MADTLAIAAQVTYTPDTSSTRVAVSPGEFTKTITMTGTTMQSGTMALTTTEAALDIGGMTADTEGYLLIKNTDGTNNVTAGFNKSIVGAGGGSNGDAHPILLKPGEFALFRVNTTPTTSALTVASAASTASISYWLFAN